MQVVGPEKGGRGGEQRPDRPADRRLAPRTAWRRATRLRRRRRRARSAPARRPPGPSGRSSHAAATAPAGPAASCSARLVVGDLERRRRARERVGAEAARRREGAAGRPQRDLGYVRRTARRRASHPTAAVPSSASAATDPPGRSRRGSPRRARSAARPAGARTRGCRRNPVVGHEHPAARRHGERQAADVVLARAEPLRRRERRAGAGGGRDPRHVAAVRPRAEPGDHGAPALVDAGVGVGERGAARAHRLGPPERRAGRTPDDADARAGARRRAARSRSTPRRRPPSAAIAATNPPARWARRSMSRGRPRQRPRRARRCRWRSRGGRPPEPAADRVGGRRPVRARVAQAAAPAVATRDDRPPPPRRGAQRASITGRSSGRSSGDERAETGSARPGSLAEAGGGTVWLGPGAGQVCHGVASATRRWARTSPFTERRETGRARISRATPVPGRDAEDSPLRSADGLELGVERLDARLRLRVALGRLLRRRAGRSRRCGSASSSSIAASSASACSISASRRRAWRCWFFESASAPAAARGRSAWRRSPSSPCRLRPRLGLALELRALLAHAHVLGPAADVGVQRPVLDRDRARADRVEQRAVVGDQQQRAGERLQRGLERLAALEVEVVRRLVEDQHVRARAARAWRARAAGARRRTGRRAASRPPRR